MLGEEGLRQSTEIAILNANYIKKKLESSYNILYLGEKNRVGHEMIIDCRPFKALDIEVSDIAKRLMDWLCLNCFISSSWYNDDRAN